MIKLLVFFFVFYFFIKFNLTVNVLHGSEGLRMGFGTAKLWHSHNCLKALVLYFVTDKLLVQVNQCVLNILLFILHFQSLL